MLGLSLVAKAIATPMHRLSGFAQRHRVARPYRKNEQAFVESFPRTLRKECLGWCSYKFSEREELQKEVQECVGY